MRLKLLTLLLGAAFLLLSGFRPGTLPYTPGAPFSDAATSHLPAAQFLRASMQQGVFPVWRETILAGAPFAANPLNKTAYPPQWLALLLPPVLHLDVMIVLHLLLAGVGMWVWARAHGLRDEAACLSALAYALAPRVIGHTGAGHLDLLYALAWFPWLMWSVGRVIDGAVVHPKEGAHMGAPLRRSLYVALFGALMVLADVRLSLFAYALAGSYGLYEAIRLKRTRALVWFVPAALLVLALTLSLTVPLLGWSPYLSRAALTAEESGVFSLIPAQFVGLILPPAGGNIETLTTVGLAALALAVTGAVAARQWFWSAATVVAALYALGYNGFLWPLLVRSVPALLWFRVPSRAWLVVALIVPLLAGHGAQALLDGRLRRGQLVALVIASASAASGVFLIASVPAVNGWALLVGGGGFGATVLLALNGRLRGQTLALALIGIVFLDLALVGRGWFEWRAQDAWLPPDQVHLAERLTDLGAYRVYSPTYSLQQQVAEEYHLRLFGGIDPFQLAGIDRAVEQGGGITDTGYSVAMPPLNAPDLAQANRGAVPDATTLAFWGVTHVVSAYPITATALVQADRVDGVYIYENMSAALTRTSGWAANWPDLPDDTTTAGLNDTTRMAALISGAGFGILLILIGILKVRH